MSTVYRTPYERLMARRRRGRATAWCVFLLIIAAIFASRILLH
jgi:hypothetical protein